VDHVKEKKGTCMNMKRKTNKRPSPNTLMFLINSSIKISPDKIKPTQ
jgi:hypothetical protein